MLKVGVTGGIGTGKTFVCAVFETLGVPVFNADLVAKSLIKNDLDIKSKIIGILGEGAYLPNGEYNTTWVSQVIFTQPELKKAINDIVHPATILASKKWFDKQAMGHLPYAIKESALIYETKTENEFDKIIVVDAPLYLRIDRLKSRSGYKDHEALHRINQQLDQELKMKKADFIIHNDGQQAVIPQVLNLHRVLVGLSSLPL